MIRIHDGEDDGEDGGENENKDDAESNAQSNPQLNLNHPSTHTLFITAHSYCNTILHHPHDYPYLNHPYHPHHL